MDDKKQYVWQILATDAEFGTDGGFYVSDWINGWDAAEQGAHLSFLQRGGRPSPRWSLETKKLLDRRI